jgi:hypothetical protein
MRRVIVFGGLLLLGLALAKSFGAMDRDHRESNAYSWAGALPADGWLYVRNRNGPIRVEEGQGDSVTIVASRSWTGRRPQDVSFVTNTVGDNVYVCALYGGGGANDCDDDTYRYRETGWLKRRIFRIRPVTVVFTVRAPSSARINADTREGRITSDAPLAALVANTRNGSIRADKPIGMVEARTRNGSVNAIIADGPLAGDVLLETRNGTVTAELPDGVNANLSMLTRNGRVSSEFQSIQSIGGSSGSQSRTSISGILGAGGPTVTLESRNGSVRLKRRPAKAEETPDSVTAAAPAAGTN